jgi:hypothetical protein
MMCGIVLTLLLVLFTEGKWSHAAINIHLQRMSAENFSPIPHAARNVSFDGTTYGGQVALTLVFDAPSSEAISFAKQFCQGILLIGYNSFEAEDSVSEMPGAYLIIQDTYSGEPFRYYLRTKGDASDVMGNRCSQVYPGYAAKVNVRVSVKQISEAVHTVNLDLLIGCPKYLCSQGLWGTVNPIGGQLPGEIVK